MSLVVVDRCPPNVQPCPACDGSMPPDAVTVGEWSLAFEDGRPVWRRELSMCCPHCDHAESHHEVQDF